MNYTLLCNNSKLSAESVSYLTVSGNWEPEWISGVAVAQDLSGGGDAAVVLKPPVGAESGQHSHRTAHPSVGYLRVLTT